MKPTDIIKQLFVVDSNAGWDQADDFEITLYETTTAIDIGGVKAGTEISYASVNFTEGTVSLSTHSGVELEKMALKVTVEPITE